jgi:hypothetical protein
VVEQSGEVKVGEVLEDFWAHTLIECCCFVTEELKDAIRGDIQFADGQLNRPEHQQYVKHQFFTASDT